MASVVVPFREAFRLKQRRESVTDPNEILTVGIDQSLSNTAMVLFKGKKPIDRVVHHTGDSTTKKYKDKVAKGHTIFGEFFEEPHRQVEYMIDKMINTIAEWNPRYIGIEGLAFDARSNTERQLAGIFFGFLAQARRELLYDLEDLLVVVPSQAKKLAREQLPVDDRYLPPKKAGGKERLNPMTKKDMVKALHRIPEDVWILDGYTRSTLAASRTTPTGYEDLPDAYFIGRYTIKQKVRKGSKT